MADNELMKNGLVNKAIEKAGIDPPDAEEIAKAGVLGKGTFDRTINKFIKGAKGNTSVIGMATKNTFEFPVFVSSSVPLDYAESTCEILEQVYASYIQMAISMNPIVDARDLKKGGFLSNFKTNTTKYLEYAEEPYEFDSCHNEIRVDDTICEFDMMSIEDDDARVINEFCSYEPLSEFDHFFNEAASNGNVHNNIVGKDGLSEKQYMDVFAPGGSQNQQQFARAHEGWLRYQRLLNEVKQDAADSKLTEKQRDTFQKQIDNFEKSIEKANEEIKKLKDENVIAPNPLDLDTDKLTVHQKKTFADAEKALLDLEKAEADIGKDKLGKSYGDEVAARRLKASAEANLKQTELNLAAERLQRERNKDARERTLIKGPEIMDESKINKLNSMKPLMMRVQLRVQSRTGQITEYPVELICGVKVHCRVVDANVLPEVAKFPIKDMNPLTRKVKWRAGELKFFKDLLFNIKEKKQSAIDARDPSKKWYRRLYALAHQKGDSFVSKNISGNPRTGLIPNASIIMTQNDVEMIKSETEIDLLKGSTGCKLCREMFLMALVVIDQDRESVKLLIPDLGNDYDVKSIASINKKIAELSTAGAKTRDIFKLLG